MAPVMQLLLLLIWCRLFRGRIVSRKAVVASSWQRCVHKLPLSVQYYQSSVVCVVAV
jgi:hypothetical protein